MSSLTRSPYPSTVMLRRAPAVGKITESAGSCKHLRHEWLYAETVLLEMDAEKHLLRDGDVAGKTPEHIRRVEAR